MRTEIFTHTDPKPDEGDPAFISVNRDTQGRYSITVLGPRAWSDYAERMVQHETTIPVTPELLENLAVAVLDHLGWS